MLRPRLFASAILLSILSTSFATNTGKALYFLDNLPNNGVVAVNIGPDGLLSDGTIVPTGGKGAPFVFAGTTTPAVPAALDSSGAVAVYKDFLLAVNPASNTVSMFQINPNSPTQLTPIGKPFDTLGDWPTSIAISPALNQACIGNTGARSGIACFHVSNQGLTPVSAFISVPLNQSNPPLAILAVPQLRAILTSISFNSNSSALLATITAAPNLNNPGYLSIYPVVNGIVSSGPKLISPTAANFLFSSLNIPGTSKVLATDPLYGAAIIDTSSSGNGSFQMIPIKGQGASCWAVLSSYTNTTFVADAAINRIAEIDQISGAVIQIIAITNGNFGALDLVSIGSKIYNLSPGIFEDTTAIVVLDASGGRGTAKVVQNFQPKGLGPTPFALSSGLAWY